MASNSRSEPVNSRGFLRLKDRRDREEHREMTVRTVRTGTTVLTERKERPERKVFPVPMELTVQRAGT
jgi:hypothetical protein